MPLLCPSARLRCCRNQKRLWALCTKVHWSTKLLDVIQKMKNFMKLQKPECKVYYLWLFLHIPYSLLTMVHHPFKWPWPGTALNRIINIRILILVNPCIKAKQTFTGSYLVFTRPRLSSIICHPSLYWNRITSKKTSPTRSDTVIREIVTPLLKSVYGYVFLYVWQWDLWKRNTRALQLVIRFGEMLSSKYIKTYSIMPFRKS